MTSETLQEVIRLVAAQIGVAESGITVSTRLGEDLGVDGDDASELIMAFASRFHVDIGDFDFSRHFGPEAGFSPFCIHPSPPLEPVTVGCLAEIAERRVWSYVA